MPTARHKAGILLPLVILLLGAGLRLHGLARDARLHPDEALYSTFSRDAAIKGDWLLQRPLDKPPFSFYAGALAMTFVGARPNDAGVLDFARVQVGEFAARLPNTLASLLLLAVVYGLAKRLYRQRPPALLALLVMSLSPFAVAFSPTAFTDIWMTFWMVSALWMIVSDRWGVSGWCLALAIASKQPALLYLPLLLPLGALRHGIRLDRLARFTLALALGMALLLLWDGLRGQPTIWQVSAARENYPGGLAAAGDLLPRLTAWLGYGGWLLGPPWLTAILVAFSLLALPRWLRRLGDKTAQTDALLLVYVLGYGLLHWLVAFNTFDRYLLPILVPLALLAARGMTQRDSRFVLARMGLVALLMLPAAGQAASGRVPVGGDQGDHEGIDRLADYLNSKPVATVVYDHWLNWELEYYMGPWSDKRRVYYPTSEALVKDALLLPEIGARYFPVPRDQSPDPWLNALQDAGFSTAPVYVTARFIVYQVMPPAAAKGA